MKIAGNFIGAQAQVLGQAPSNFQSYKAAAGRTECCVLAINIAGSIGWIHYTVFIIAVYQSEGVAYSVDSFF